ncbi:MAG: Ti-type conjugative transfer relaxase TraA [Rhodocyclaceae bacterium]|nr:Ti-type conjugative transfer relaxase TraA [Rhodocyclaceae bacterium]MCA3118244.1 Ti-type conjugative transfer relaxase TraA [Rhodocyclaceae bacterium]MCA3124751.1 Ti-type conjugative transfer relaxase TraA [Rhodocyclaceae bacterium]MCA3129216.1 Ti-type conjugative transfer relaxase TraA [Rhodocyclaceae bacterium]MCA3140388.1 Ti-type conjugative transfer relaxase TraA [Rhodocyclaceae bacterium]
MAIYHCSTAAVSRSSGRSAVAAAAYRSGTALTNERDGLVHDYTPRKGIEHRQIVLPENLSAAWANDRSTLWNAAEAAEKRKDARVAREVEVSLPHELDAKQRQALAVEMAQHLADRYRVAVDLAIHSPHGKTDARNHHAHLLMTTRTLTRTGLGAKSMLERENRELARQGLPTTHQQVRELREAWADLANRHLARAEHDLRIDHRSNAARGIELTPTAHMGVQATQMSRKGLEVSRASLTVAAAQRNAALIRESPDQVLAIITAEKSVFDHRDVARVVNRYTEGAGQFQSVYGQVMASPELVRLTKETRDPGGRVQAPALYSTRDMIAVEARMDACAGRLAAGGGYAVSASNRAAALDARQGPKLDEGQRNAFTHVTGPEQLSVVVGFAGSGKSSMLGAAREAWQWEGFTVRGGALAGKAAEGLQGASGIESRTLASWERSWAAGRDLPSDKQVYVIDEAGMVSSRQLERVMSKIEEGGAKAVLVGDPGQLQPIEAGAAFRAVAERAGFAQMDTVRRQQEAWQREASVAFGQHRTAEALRAYAERGAVKLAPTREAAREAVVKEYVADLRARPEGSRVALAHRRDDVRALNDAIRNERQAAGELRGERAYATTEGNRCFAPGDRILFRENNRELGVKNGTMGTVTKTESDQITARLDGPAGPGSGRAVSIPTEQYKAVDHGYATTIHKSQGTTVDRSYVLASGSMDRHLSYVAMTRHTESAQLHASREEFRDTKQVEQQLSRSGAKETTLDYTRAAQGFTERRGRELDSQIVLRSEPRLERERPEAVVRREPTAPAVERDAPSDARQELAERPSSRDPVRSEGPAPASRPEGRPALSEARDRVSQDLPAMAQSWKGLEQRLDQLQGRKDGPARDQVLQEMRGIAARIRDNPVLKEDFLRQQRDLGIRRGSSLDRAVRDRNLDRALEQTRDRENDRGR